MTKKEAAAATTSALNAALRERIVVADKSLTQTKGDCTFQQCMPEGMTMEQVKAVDDYRKTFVAAVARVASEKGLELRKSDKDITQVNFEMPMYDKGPKVQVMLGEEMHLAVIDPITNPKAGELREVFQNYQRELDNLFKD